MATPSKDPIYERQHQWTVNAAAQSSTPGSQSVHSFDRDAAYEKYQPVAGASEAPKTESPVPTAPTTPPSTPTTPTTQQTPVKQGGADVGYGLLGSNGKVGGLNYEVIPGQSYTPADVNLKSYNPGSVGDYLSEWLTDSQQQQNNAINYATQQGINELQRAKEDADAMYQTQRNQVDIDEARAKDNQALYAESRGDKGGIGAAQYSSIMNTAAQNRLQVNNAQTKLSTDTARQIADLRAQGEYQKADAMLTLTQQYLSKLTELEQWSLQFGLDVAQFNSSLEQWKAEYDMKAAELTGMFQGKFTLAYKQQLASDGAAALAAGIMPSADQLLAMGLTAEEAQNQLTLKTLSAEVPRLSNYSEAVAFLRSRAFMQTEIDEILTPDKWTALRSKYLSTGQGNAASINYDSYVNYLNDHVLYLLSR